MALLAALVLLTQPGTTIAAETTQDRPPLARGAGYNAAEQPKAPTRVATLQRGLRRLGWKPGPVDGLFGPRTEAAVRRFQQATRIAVDGIVGTQTTRTLAWAYERPAVRSAAYLQPRGPVRVRALQAELRDRGLRPGPVDGVFGPRTRAAVVRLATGRRPGPAPPLALPAVLRTVQPLMPHRPTASAAGASLGDSATGDEVDSKLMLAVTLPALLSALLAAALGGRTGSLLRSPTTPVPDSPAPPLRLAAPPPEPPALPARHAVRAIGYVSVPAAEPLEGPMMQEQTQAIAALCEKRGWTLVELVHDVERERGRSVDRPGLSYVLERLAKREATCLVVSALPRLSPSAAELGRILGSIGRNGGRFVALDDKIDTADPAGRKAANLLVRVGAWERNRLGERTRKGLAVVRAQGGAISRPSVEDVPALKRRIIGMRASGMTLQAIADSLNEQGVPTLRGGREWRPSSVQSAAGYRRPRKG